MIDILAGRTPPPPVPRQVTEYFCAKEFGWTPEKTRHQPYGDVDIMTSILAAVYRYNAQKK